MSFVTNKPETTSPPTLTPAPPEGGNEGPPKLEFNPKNNNIIGSVNQTNGQDMKPTITINANQILQPQNTNMGNQQLVDFLPSLEDYTPTIPDAVTGAYLNSAGFSSSDARVVRLISLAAQKFLSDVANDALQHCRVRTSNQSSKTKAKDRMYTLTMDDLTPALSEHGIAVRKPSYFV